MTMELVRSDVGGAGFRRRRCGRGFRYFDWQAVAIKDPEILARIKALVIPPAWEDVWICPEPNGHIDSAHRITRRVGSRPAHTPGVEVLAAPLAELDPMRDTRTLARPEHVKFRLIPRGQLETSPYNTRLWKVVSAALIPISARHRPMIASSRA